MIIPSRKMVFWAALCGLPFGTLVGLGGVSPLPSFLVISAFLVVVFLDAFLSFRPSRQVNLSWEEDFSTTVGKTTAFPLVLEGKGFPKVRLHLETSEHLFSPQPQLTVQLPLENNTLEWELQPRFRGKATVERLWMARFSPMGLWECQSEHAIDLTVRVLPNLESGSSSLKDIMRQLASGAHHMAAWGQGQEFDRLRLYKKGDHFGDIDWKATARKQYPVTRQYRVERSQNVIIFIDASRSSSRRLPKSAADEPQLLDTLVKVALCISRVVESKGDKIGLLIHDHQVRRYLAPSRGRDHQSRLMNALFDAQAGPLPTRSAALYASAKTLLPKRSLVIVLGQTRERNTRDQVLRSAPLLAKNHHLIFAELTDPFEHPPFTGDALQSQEELYEHFQGYLTHEEHRTFGLELRRRGIAFLSMPIEQYPVGILHHYLELKSRATL